MSNPFLRRQAIVRRIGPLLAKMDLGTGHNMTPGLSGGGMHRTDSIDVVIVIGGEGK